MLKVRLGNVIKYANLHPHIFEDAVKQFFGEIPGPHMEGFDRISGLFNEWLVFDYKLKSSTTFLKDYFLKNPDNLSEELLDELKQIIETQCFDMLEIQSIKRGEWIKAYGLYSGKMYHIYEHTGSLTAPSRGTFWGRVAKVNNQYLLVGSDPAFFPTTATPRLKKFYLENKPKQFSPKDVLPLLLPQKTKESGVDKKQMTPKQLENKRKSLEKRFVLLQERGKFVTSFQKVCEFIYNENYKTNFADFFADLIKSGLPEKVVFSNPELFNDMWNYFPHKKLHGKSPYEMFKKRYG